MALLESVSLSVGFSDSQQLVRWVRRITAFVAAPRLRSVTLFSPSPWGLFESDLPMPWSQLTTLYLRESATLLYACLDVLSKCTNLVDCMVNIDATAVEGIQPHVPIVIRPCLGKLHLLFVEPGEFSPFFQHLNLPALKDLTVETIYGYRWSHQSFTEFALRSSLDLEHLRFGYVNIRQMSSCCSLHVCNHSSSSTSSTRSVLIIAYLVRYVIAKWTIIILFQGSRHCSFPMPRVITLMTSSSQA